MVCISILFLCIFRLLFVASICLCAVCSMPSKKMGQVDMFRCVMVIETQASTVYHAEQRMSCSLSEHSTQWLITFNGVSWHWVYWAERTFLVVMKRSRLWSSMCRARPSEFNKTVNSWQRNKNTCLHMPFELCWGNAQPQCGNNLCRIHLLHSYFDHFKCKPY